MAPPIMPAVFTRLVCRRARLVSSESGWPPAKVVGATVGDHSVVGVGCIVRAGAVVKQRSQFAAGTDIDGFPATEIGRLTEAPPVPTWAWQPGDLPG